jgi:hypothetical protein
MTDETAVPVSMPDFALPDLDATPSEITVPTDPLDRRRADIDAKQARVATILADMGCEGVILLVPAHVAWFTGGINVRGLIAETERPGVYTNGKQRWLICSNVDTQRLFDEELDGLGFQVKEWQWSTGRALLLGELAAGKKTASDRPFPNMPLINDRLRTELRPLAPFDRDRYLDLGRWVTHAVEATARTLAPGDSEAEVAGQVAHRLHRYGADVAGVSVTADARGRKFRRAGFTDTPVVAGCVIQATGTRDGLYVTTSRTVWFGPPDDAFRAEQDAACRLSGVYRLLSRPNESVGTAAEAGRRVTVDGPYEYEWRQSQPGYGAGWYPAEELRRLGQDEKFVADQAVVWQARVGAAAIVDTILVGADGPVPVTPPDGWPFKRVSARGATLDVPDLLVRTG